jgi:hypothetical protein
MEFALAMGHDRGMTKSNLALKSHRITIRMTGPMYANLQRLAGTQPRMGELIREAIRQYLDDQGELTGSRRYFTGRFRDEVHGLREEQGWYLTLIIILLAEMLSFLIRGTVKFNDEETASQFTASGILRMAAERLVESGHRVRERVSAAVDNAMLKAQQREDEGG